MEFEQIAVKADLDFALQEPLLDNTEWTIDVVYAKGVVHDGVTLRPGENLAELRFNYEIMPGKEFELLHYTDGPNFLQDTQPGLLSHFGVHVPDINDFRDYLLAKGFYLVQEVITMEHSNVPPERHYHYAIYRHQLLGFHWKLIKRLDEQLWNAAQIEMNKRYNHVIF